MHSQYVTELTECIEILQAAGDLEVADIGRMTACCTVRGC